MSSILKRRIHRFTRRILRLSSNRTRSLFILCLVTLGVSVGMAGSVLFMRWQTDRLAHSDMQLILDQATPQLAQLLQSRRETFVLLRDTLDKVPDLNETEQTGLIKSALEHTPYLVGSGLIQKKESILWWMPPASIASQEREWGKLIHDVAQRTWLRTLFHAHSVLTASLDNDHPLLVIIEPFSTRANRSHPIITFLDLKPLLADFFKSALREAAPLQLVEGDKVLYRSRRWQRPGRGPYKPIVERSVRFDGVQWVFQMQTGVPRMVPRSWLNLLVATILLLAGLATMGMVWTTERLRQLATTDELTGLYNRRFFLERWDWEVERAKRYGRHLSCLMIDVNGFKRVNDLLGHPMGDRLLKQVAQDLKKQMRRTDLLARFGGDEFIAALPEADLQQAEKVAQKLKGLFIQGPWIEHHLHVPIALSVGLSQMQKEDSPEEIIRRADADLYASRQIAQGQSDRTLSVKKASSFLVGM